MKILKDKIRTKNVIRETEASGFTATAEAMRLVLIDLEYPGFLVEQEEMLTSIG